MRLSLLTLAASAVFGLVLSVGDASACHKKKACATPAVCAAPAPAPVVECAPVKKKCFGHKKHKAVACAAPSAPCGVAYESAPASYAPSPVYATGQGAPSGQGY